MPCGLIINAAMIRMKVTPTDQPEPFGTNVPTYDSASASTRLARIVPPTLPRPPTITIANAFNTSGTPTNGNVYISTLTTDPATPATAAAAPNVIIWMKLTLIPTSALAV